MTTVESLIIYLLAHITITSNTIVQLKTPYG